MHARRATSLPHGTPVRLPVRSRRGVTFLEVVLSVVLLSMVTGAVLSAINGVVAQQSRQMHRLGAAELANRLMLQYIDDKESMPQRGLPVGYGRDLYRWELSEEPVTLTHAKAEVAARGNPNVSLNRLRRISISVWLAEESGGTYQNDGITPSFRLSRVVDPVFGQLRNPDTANHILTNERLRRQFMEAVTGMSGGGSVPVTPARPARPAPSRSNQQGQPAQPGSGGK
jgi:Tfp pilus assembly protein PilV